MHHVKGKDNQLADFLSRNFVADQCNIKVIEVDEINVINVTDKFIVKSKIRIYTKLRVKQKVVVLNEIPVAYTKLTELQRSDECCSNIRVESIKNETNKSNFYLKNGILCSKRMNGVLRVKFICS